MFRAALFISSPKAEMTQDVPALMRGSTGAHWYNRILLGKKGKRCWYMLLHGWILKILCCAKEARHKSHVLGDSVTMKGPEWTDSGSVVTRGWWKDGSGREECSLTSNRYRVSFWAHEKVLELVVVVVKQYAWARSHWIPHFQMWILCELYQKILS